MEKDGENELSRVNVRILSNRRVQDRRKNLCYWQRTIHKYNLCTFTQQQKSQSTRCTIIRQSNPDGSAIGTQSACRIKPKQLILSTDLEDDRAAIGEEALQAAWKEKFGKQLDLNFFKNFGLKDSVKDDPTCTESEIQQVVFTSKHLIRLGHLEIGPEYDGPAVFYEVQKELREVPEGQEEVSRTRSVHTRRKTYARSRSQPIYLNVRTPFGYKRNQKIDIVDEVEQQVRLMDAGLTPEETRSQ